MRFCFWKKKKRGEENTRRKQGVTRRGGKSAALPQGMLRVFAACAAVALLTGSAWAYRHFYLYRNDRYTLREVDVFTGQILTRELVIEGLQLEVGKNIFDVCDMAEKRKKVLRSGFVAREVTLTRHLPDKLVVKITEREPVARMAEDHMLLVDGEGMVFIGGWPSPLPRISGVHGQVFGPGTRLLGMGSAAAMFARVLGTANVNFPVERVDASKEDFLTLTLPGQRRVLLAWDGIGRVDAESEEQLRERLHEVVAMVDKIPGGRSFDARSRGQIYVR